MEIFFQLVLNSIIAGATYTLITLGFNLIYGATKFVNMAHGSLAAAGAYAAFVALRWWGWGPIAATFAGILAAGILAVISDVLIFKPLRRRRAKPLMHFIASLGFFTIMQAALSIVFSSQFFPLAMPGEGKVFEIAGASVTGIQLLIIVFSATVSLALFLLLQRTMFGKVVRAVSDDEEVAKMLGIHTDRTITKVFFVGGACAGLAGVLTGFDTGAQPTMGLFILVEGVIPSIVGGVGNMVGGILGAFLLGFAENFGIWFIPSQWKGAIAFGLLALFLVFRPQGILGKK